MGDYMRHLNWMSRVLVALTMATLMSGCFVRRVDLWGAKMEFAEGFDVHAGTNAIDKVDDRRGINRFEAK